MRKIRKNENENGDDIEHFGMISPWILIHPVVLSWIDIFGVLFMKRFPTSANPRFYLRNIVSAEIQTKIQIES